MVMIFYITDLIFMHILIHSISRDKNHFNKTFSKLVKMNVKIN